MNRPRSVSGRGGWAASGCRQWPAMMFAATSCALLLFSPAVPAAAQVWRFEAEDINPANCYVQNGLIQVAICGDASGGMALDGLNMLGDYAEIPITFDRETCLVDSIRCAGTVNSSWQFRVDFFAEGNPTPVVTSVHAKIDGRGFS
jgi:hypothetical protein